MWLLAFQLDLTVPADVLGVQLGSATAAIGTPVGPAEGSTTTHPPAGPLLQPPNHHLNHRCALLTRNTFALAHSRTNITQPVAAQSCNRTFVQYNPTSKTPPDRRL